MGDCEFGRCEICGKDSYLERTYFHYDIECECHSPKHFELVRHCKDCRGIEPRVTTIRLKTINLDRLDG